MRRKHYLDSTTKYYLLELERKNHALLNSITLEELKKLNENSKNILYSIFQLINTYDKE